MTTAQITYVVNGTTQTDYVSGSIMATQTSDGGAAIVTFPERDGVVRSSPDGQVLFSGVRALHYTECGRIVKFEE
jgi:hypothetical protein